jgi:hypothetical protein
VASLFGTRSQKAGPVRLSFFGSDQAALASLLPAFGDPGLEELVLPALMVPMMRAEHYLVRRQVDALVSARELFEEIEVLARGRILHASVDVTAEDWRNCGERGVGQTGARKMTLEPA